MGLADWFKTFCGNIQVQNGAVISLRYKAITKRLNTDFWETDSDTSHSLYVGSYGRNTAIHGTSDVDMIFQLPYSVYKRCFRHQLLLPHPYLVLTKPLRLDIQCQRAASVKIGWKYLDD